jgi:hypothetical protein
MADQPEITITEIVVTHPQGFGGHEFEYESDTDLFRCTRCGKFEVVVRQPDGSILECQPTPPPADEPADQRSREAARRLDEIVIELDANDTAYQQALRDNAFDLARDLERAMVSLQQEESRLLAELFQLGKRVTDKGMGQ